MRKHPAINLLFKSFGILLYLYGSMTNAATNADASNSTAAVAPQKIHINADHMTMNIITGNSTYTGSVKISQGELVLTGDVVTLEQDNNEIERLIVTGKPARYNHVTDQGEKIEAQSEQMVYTASKNLLVMTINAKLEQPDSTLASQKIIYDTANKIVIAGDRKNSDKDQRVNIILTPKPAPENQPR